MNLGTVVIEGYTYQITSIRFYGGKMIIRAFHDGPVPPCEGVPATVFGEDGQGICQAWNMTITKEELRGANCVTVWLPILIASLETVEDE